MIRRRRHFPAGGLRSSHALHTLLSLLEDDNAATDHDNVDCVIQLRAQLADVAEEFVVCCLQLALVKHKSERHYWTRIKLRFSEEKDRNVKIAQVERSVVRYGDSGLVMVSG